MVTVKKTKTSKKITNKLYYNDKQRRLSKLVSGKSFDMFIMLIILFCVQYVVPKKPSLVMLLVYVFEIVLYVFGIRISMLHADKPAVSAVAFLLVSPLLFYDRPIRLSAPPDCPR